MDDRFRDILDSLPPKPPRSRLEPYAELINELRHRGTTYRNTAKILAEECQLEVSASTVHDFVRVRSRTNEPGSAPCFQITYNRLGDINNFLHSISLN